MSRKKARRRGQQRSEEQDYEVGYRKPPVKSRFKSGQSGNPRGRPPGSKNLKTLLRELAARRISVREEGKLRRLTGISIPTWLATRFVPCWRTSCQMAWCLMQSSMKASFPR